MVNQNQQKINKKGKCIFILMLWQVMSDYRMNHCFQEADEDGGGGLDMDEFRQAMIKTMAGKGEVVRGELFQWNFCDILVIFKSFLVTISSSSSIFLSVSICFCRFFVSSFCSVFGV